MLTDGTFWVYVWATEITNIVKEKFKATVQSDRSKSSKANEEYNAKLGDMLFYSFFHEIMQSLYASSSLDKKLHLLKCPSKIWSGVYLIHDNATSQV